MNKYCNLRFKMQSRHQASKKYDLYIQYIPSIDDASGITGWYCKCRAGARVVGCCAHICSVLYYIGFRRFDPTWKPPAAKIAVNIKDAADRSPSPQYDVSGRNDLQVCSPSHSKSKKSGTVVGKRKKSVRIPAVRATRGRVRLTSSGGRRRYQKVRPEETTSNESNDVEPCPSNTDLSSASD